MKALLAIILAALALSCRAAIPPPAGAIGAEAAITADFTAFDPAFIAKRRIRVAGADALAQRLSTAEARGENNDCAYQILFETRSLLISSADFAHIDRRLSDLRRSLAHPRADRTDAEGMRGACYDTWWQKLYATYAWLDAHAPEEPESHPLPAFLAPVATPDRVRAHLEALAVSNVGKEGVDHEREFNDTLASLLQMIVRGRPENYAVDPALRLALLDIVLNQIRDPATSF